LNVEQLGGARVGQHHFVEVVDGDDAVAAAKEQIDEVRAEEARAAR